MIKKLSVSVLLVVLIPFLSACGVELKDNDPKSARANTPPPGSLAEKSNRPAEFVINEKIILEKNMSWIADRIFIGENAEIITGEYSLTIEAGELHVGRGARILNFSTRAEIDKHGRHGGGILLRAQTAQGFLQLNLRGEDGGVGRPGAITVAGHRGCAGGDGRNGGNAGYLIAEFGESQKFELSIENQQSMEGAGGVRGSVPKYTPHAINPSCVETDPEGIDGQPGAKGVVCIRRSAQESLECSR